MNAEVENQLLDATGKIMDWIERTEDFVLTQAPLVVQELIRLKIVQNSIVVSISLVAILILTYFIISLLRRGIKTNKLDDPDIMCPICILCFIAVAPITTFCIYLNQLLLVTLAPRVYILEYLSSMIK